MDTSENCGRKMFGNKGRGVGLIEPFMNLSQKIFNLFLGKIFYIFQDKCFFFLLTNRQWEAGNGSQKDDGEQTAAKLFNMMMITEFGLNPLVEKTVQDYFLFYQFLSGVVFPIQIL